ncbi:MAG: chemotaxis protein CheD [Candidatus Magnetoovum sp. WYHC-5]|nr:chemotaxis protein CheD [Candidatus Magnetoovum sp. WYHC-5]
MIEHFLYPGNIFAEGEDSVITTILGSCVSVCLWDPVLKVGGMNHYLLPLWNGDGLPSPKYGNIAIPKLIDKLLYYGCNVKSLRAKTFGGAAVIERTTTSGLLNVGERNIFICRDMLEEAGIPIVASDLGGTNGRKIIFQTDTGGVLMKKIKKTTEVVGVGNNKKEKK